MSDHAQPRLIHYSAAPLGPLYSVDQTDGDCRVRGDKPKGLWVSIEGEQDWKSWCEAERFSLESLRFAHEIVLAPGANILRLSTPDDIDRLTERYAAPAIPGLGGRVYGLRWDQIAERHHGIIIAPYIFERRLNDHAFWYYGWDCASGCIWDAAAIGEVSLLKEASHDC